MPYNLTVIDIVRQASKAVGGPGKLAGAIGVSRQQLYQWKRVPGERVIAIEIATGGKISRHVIRPDLYPPIATVRPRGKAA